MLTGVQGRVMQILFKPGVCGVGPQDLPSKRGGEQGPVRVSVCLCVCVGGGVLLIGTHHVSATCMIFPLCLFFSRGMQGAGMHHRSLQPMKTLLCMHCKRAGLPEKVDMGTRVCSLQKNCGMFCKCARGEGWGCVGVCVFARACFFHVSFRVVGKFLVVLRRRTAGD